MYNVLILGATGMLGQMVMNLLSKDKRLNIVPTSTASQDSFPYFNALNGIERLEKIVNSQNPPFNYIINCIGILSENIDDKDSKSVYDAIVINSLFPNYLSSLAMKTKSRVIHISTDGVFGKNLGVCKEDNICNPNDLYGKTKSIGEGKGFNFLNIRTSIIGPNPNKKTGLMEWFLSQPRNGEVYGFSDQIWNGVTTLQFAELCKMLILENYFDTVYSEAPIHHFCPNQSISKYELLKLFKYIFRPDLTIIPQVNVKKAVSRYLDTNYQSINGKFGNNIQMKEAIKTLSSAMK